jgi:5,10-methenyltetrahydromethanopterin hydrogenase
VLDAIKREALPKVKKKHHPDPDTVRRRISMYFKSKYHEIPARPACGLHFVLNGEITFETAPNY